MQINDQDRGICTNTEDRRPTYPDRESRNQQQKTKLKQLSKQVYPKFERYRAQDKIKLLYKFAKHDIREQQLFKSVEDKLSTQLSNLSISLILTLLQTLRLTYKCYKGQKRIFKMINLYINKIQKVQAHEFYPLVRELISLNWSTSTINSLLDQKNQQLLTKMSNIDLLRTTILEIEQNFVSMKNIKKWLQLCIKRTNQINQNNDVYEICLAFYLFQGKFLNHRLSKIHEYYLNRSNMNSIMGQSSFDERIKIEYEQLSRIANQINIGRLEKILVIVKEKMTIEQSLLILECDNQQLKSHIKKLFNQGYKNLNALEFMGFYEKFKQQQLFINFYNQNKNLMNVKEKLYLFRKLAGKQFPELIKSEIEYILQTKPEITPIQFEGLIKLAYQSKVDDAKIKQYLDYMETI